jgi:hypothetical protein
MPLSEIDAEWLEIIMTNGAFGPKGAVEVNAQILTYEALLAAPEASREEIAYAIFSALPAALERVRRHRMETEQAFPPDQLLRIETFILNACAALRTRRDSL